MRFHRAPSLKIRTNVHSLSLLHNHFNLITSCLSCMPEQLSSPLCHVQNQRLPWKPLRWGDHPPSQDTQSGRQRHSDRQSNGYEQQWGEPAAIRGQGSQGGGGRGGQESGLLLPMQEEEMMEGLWLAQNYLFSSLLRPFSERKGQKQGIEEVKNVDKKPSVEEMSRKGMKESYRCYLGLVVFA